MFVPGKTMPEFCVRYASAVDAVFEVSYQSALLSPQ
jgi:hypothetical protein